MTPQTAVEDLNRKKIAKHCGSHPIFSDELIDTAIYALERLIPKKPKLVQQTQDWKEGLCPICGHIVFAPYGCRKCLNAIDWEEEKVEPQEEECDDIEFDFDLIEIEEG